jgi:hypothetical protein
VDEKELREIVTGFRGGVIGKRSSDRMCLAVCAPLQGLLSAFGYETELVEGDFEHTNHYWLRLPDGRIIDPTADQFTTPTGARMPKVYIGELPEWYRPA